MNTTELGADRGHLYTAATAGAIRPEAVAGKVRLELDEATLLRLLIARDLCISDFRCLDSASKQRIKALLITACKHAWAERHCDGVCDQCELGRL